MEGNFLKTLHFNKIELVECICNTDFSFALSKAINLNRKRLKAVRIMNHCESMNLKKFLIILTH